MPETSFIQLNRLSKRFGGVTALDEVSFDIRRGEVHAVVGENGAGKSTLMKLLAGVYEPDAGEIKIESQPARLKNPRDARRQGVSIVFQELNLFPHRTVTANVFANRESTNRWGGLRRNQMRDATRQALSELGVNLSPDAVVGSLSIGEKQFVEIARTLEEKARIVILDEPNSALGETESQRLFEIIRRLRGRGITLIYISHRLEEVFAIADRITVLRDGQYQGTYETRDTTIPKIITVMIGRPAENLFPQKKADASQGPVTLQVRELCRKPRLGPISFSARAGEVVGFAGLEGAGVNELFRVLFGLDEMTSGQIVVRDEPQESTGPSAAMRRGWAMIPENRREQGLMMDWSIARNATLLILDKLLNRLGLIDKNQVRSTTGSLIQRLGISTNQQETKVVNLSGGNQQKVLLAKWLALGPSILILDNPTRGVDVGAKMEIYALCHQLAGQGMTILLASSETEEILGLADRVLVLAKGKVIHEFQRDEVSKGELMHAMSGTAVVTGEKS
ncbi:MAG: sugar ABC transporter ATP-binding protein [Verrucomicrobiota bacterium]